MTELHLDTETYSRRNIKDHSSYSYSEDRDFQILMCAWALDDDPVQVAIGATEVSRILPAILDPDIIKVAHNANFERVCFSRFQQLQGSLAPGLYLPPEEWDDPAVIAAELGYPRKLEHLGVALGGELKDSAGTRLINLFCKPNRKGQRNRPEDYPEEWALFVEYCRQDVVTHRDAYRKMSGWPSPAEREAWITDQRINDRGIPVDLEMAAAAVEEGGANQMLQEIQMASVSGVRNPNSGPQVLAWLKSRGVRVSNLQKETVEGLLAGELEDDVRRVLELRQELALVAGKKYVSAISRTSPDARLRGSFRFFGAHTGRWSGSGVQLQNLPAATLGEKDTPGPELDAIIQAAVLDLKLGMPTDAHTLKALVRGMFVGPFTVVDYASIEARVLAWLAGEQWALDAFALGRDIYVETAERMSTPSNPMGRKQGKVAVLALGYNGGVNALRAMGAEGTDEQLKPLVSQWRAANPAIVDLWWEMDTAFRKGGTVGNFVTVEKDGSDRYIRLPSGRVIGYHDCRLRWVEKWGKSVQEVHFADPKGPGIRTATYGGRLTENLTQAVARDVLSEALVRLDRAGLEVVGHVHDEILVHGTETVDDVKQIMVQQPTWAGGLPLAAEGFTCPRYRKG